jgi:ribonuclease P protein component
VRLSRPVNSKDGPATTAALKAELRAEITRLFASQQPRPTPMPTAAA